MSIFSRKHIRMAFVPVIIREYKQWLPLVGYLQCNRYPTHALYIHYQRVPTVVLTYICYEVYVTKRGKVPCILNWINFSTSKLSQIWRYVICYQLALNRYLRTIFNLLCLGINLFYYSRYDHWYLWYSGSTNILGHHKRKSSGLQMGVWTAKYTECGLQLGLGGVGEFDYSSSERNSNDFLIDLIDNIH